MTDPNVPPPLFTSAAPTMSQGAQDAVAQRGTPATLNLDDIFGDVVFTPDGDTVFLSEQKDDGGMLNSGEGDKVALAASKPNVDGKFQQVQNGGGLYTTALMDHGKVATTMGASDVAGKGVSAVPFKREPQKSHHLQYAAPKKKKESSRSGDRKMSEQQKVERR